MSSIEVLLRNALEVRRAHGIGLVRQLGEILRLSREAGKIGPAEYYDYRIFRDSLSYEAKREFVGWRGEHRLEVLNQRVWHALANDKLAFSAVMDGLGIPTPRTVAIYHQQRRYFGDVPCFGDAKAITDFLRGNARWPLFAKPVQGTYGKGTALIQGYDRATDTLRFANDEPCAVDIYVSHLHNPGRLGFLFQEVLQPHPALEAVCGPRLSSVRVVTIYPDAGAKIHRVIWKIPVGGNITDNFDHGLSGNLLAAVDPDTGIAKVAVAGIGLQQTEVERHPDTGAPLAGVALPQWNSVRDLVLRATRSFPGLRFQHWDISFAQGGPTVLEVNLFGAGGTDLSQTASGRGLLDPEFEDMIQRLSR